MEGFRVSRRQGGLVISHLQFVDDTILFLNANRVNAKALRNLLIWIEIVSGLSINLKNSKLCKVREV